MIRATLARIARRAGLLAPQAAAAPPQPPSPQPTPPQPGRPGGPVAGLDLDECQVFFGYCRIHGYAAIAEPERFGHDTLRDGMHVALEVDGARPDQRVRILAVQPGGTVEFELDALVPRDMPMERSFLLVWFQDGVSRFHLSAALKYSQARDLTTKLTDFNAIVERFAATEGRRPKLLDLGGRARSGVQKSEFYPHCDVTVFDIIPDPGVDVVGDAHELSRHFPADSFDFVHSVAVFEHLLMPWKAAVEVNKVLRPGGHAYIWAPQSQPIHDLPWDFFRFSDNAWHALFNRRTGFEVVAADMSLRVHMVPRVYPIEPAFPEHTLGFMSSETLVRKIGPAEVDWPVAVGDVVDTMYPTYAPGEDIPPGAVR